MPGFEPDPKPAVIKQTVYKEVASRLSVPSLSQPWLLPLQKQYGLSDSVLHCIYKQLVQQKTRHGGDVKPRLKSYTARYRKGTAFLELCYEADVPACLLLRRLLEELCGLTPGQKAVTSMLRNPERLAELAPSLDPQLVPRLCADVLVARACDSIYSPEADAARLAVGVPLRGWLEHESRLEGCLTHAGLAYWTEAELRLQGFVKTPDARLQVPVLYQNQVVTWLDSKATFGSLDIHKELHKDQYQAYLNRYGPGLVIYWFGYVEEASSVHPEILLATELPVGDLMQLPQVASNA